MSVTVCVRACIVLTLHLCRYHRCRERVVTCQDVGIPRTAIDICLLLSRRYVLFFLPPDACLESDSQFLSVQVKS